jgi:hypothetical protein
MRQTLPITLLLAALPAYSADFLPTLHRITEPVTDDGKTIAELCDQTDYDNNNLKIDLEYLASNNNTINHTINRSINEFVCASNIFTVCPLGEQIPDEATIQKMAEEANAQTLAMLKKSGATEDNCGKKISFTVKLSTSGHYRGLEQVRVNYTSFIELEKDNPYESQRHFLFDESGKHIQLADLLTYGGDNALQAPLHRAWNAHKGVEDTIISDKKIPLAKNIYFTAVGLVFHYQQEDKPARSKMNNPQILIPFAELTDVLKTDYLPENVSTY